MKKQYKYIVLIGLVFGYPLLANESVEHFPKGEVMRAQFTTAIEDREPINNVVKLNDQADKIYFFTDLRNLNGQEVVHRWEYEGKVEAEVSFNVTSNSWRAYSSKTLDSSKLGLWTVVVVNERGWPLKAVLFEYTDGVTKLLENN